MADIHELIQMLNDDPKDPFLRYAIALEHEKAGNTDESVSLLNELIKESPDYLAAYYQLGKMLLMKHQIPDAHKIIQSGIDLAQRKQNRHTLAELRQLADDLEDL